MNSKPTRDIRSLAREIARNNGQAVTADFDVASVTPIVNAKSLSHSSKRGVLALTSWEGAWDAVQHGYDRVLNVSEEHVNDSIDRAHHVPIDPSGRGIFANLELASGLIKSWLDNGEKVAVHCNMGMERAPLVVAWYLTHERHMTWDAAYELMQAERPLVLDRRAWLRKE
jgi:hypothetical protein